MHFVVVTGVSLMAVAPVVFPMHPSPGASVKNSGVSLSPAATLSAGKLIRGFTLRTLGQLPSL